MKELRLSDELWERIEPHLPRMKKRRGRSGRTPSNYRSILDGIFWVLKTGAQWSALPDCYPPKSTVHDRFQFMERRGFFKKLVDEFANDLHDEGILDLEECFIDGMFVPAKKGVPGLAKRNEGRARK